MKIHKSPRMAVLGGIILSAGLASHGHAANLELPILDLASVQAQHYSDLLSADLHTAGLRKPLAKINRRLSAKELRQHTIHYNINALINTDDPDWGLTYSASITSKHPGVEYYGVSRYHNSDIAAGHMLQVPDNFDPNKPCIISAPASGSRGIYGAIGTTAPWALSHNCAIAYTDKGSGTGFSFAPWQQTKQGYNQRGQVSPDKVQQLLNADGFNNKYQVKIKHTHDQRDAEVIWGELVLQSIEFAFSLLNQHHLPPGHASPFYQNQNTLVISTGVSNGGAAALKSVEIDRLNRIDGLVVNEPNIVLPRGLATEVDGQQRQLKSLLQRSSEIALFGPCAALALSNSPLANLLNPNDLQQRCQQLFKDGLLDIASGSKAYEKLQQLGYNKQSLDLVATATAIQLNLSLASAYSNAYLKNTVQQPSCDVAYLSQQQPGNLSELSEHQMANLAATSSGLAPHKLIGFYQLNEQGVKFVKDNTDINYQTAKCFYQLRNDKNIINAEAKRWHNPKLNTVPSIILHGSSDSVIPIEHSSMIYAEIKQQQHDGSEFRFYQLNRGQHFDAFLKQQAFAQRFVATQPYFEQSLESMWLYLSQHKPLPASQVINSQPGQAIVKINDKLNTALTRKQPSTSGSSL